MDKSQQIELIKDHLAEAEDDASVPLIKTYFRARSYCYFRGECDWDFEEYGYDREKVIEALAAGYFRDHPNPHDRIYGTNVLYISHEITLPIGLDEDGCVDVKTFRSIDSDRIDQEITAKEFKATKAWAALERKVLEEAEREKENQIKRKEAEEQRKMEIYLEMKAKLENAK